MTKVSIIGIGAWGTALGLTARRAGADVTFWSHEKDILAKIKQTGQNPYCSSDITLDPTQFALTSDITTTCAGNIIVFAIPAQVTRQVMEQFAPHLQRECFILLASKGVENQTGYLLSQIATHLFPNCEIAALSGANFADEVARNLPATTLIAAQSLTTSQWLCQAFYHPNFCPFPSDDLIGAQVAGAFKNVLAIGAGILLGTYNCRNLHAAFVTTGFQEMCMIAEALGGRRDTLLGQGGLSDIILTCFSEKSRNMSYGLSLTANTSSPNNATTIEGRDTAEVVIGLADKYKLQLPLFTAIHNVINRQASIETLVAAIYTSQG